MKRTSHLFLLVPSLFLLASCQTTPKVDTITENEAREFIETNYNFEMDHFATPPTDATTFSWEIVDTKDADGINAAKDEIKTYLGKDVGDQLKSNNVKIDEGKRSEYLEKLQALDFENSVGPAVIGMSKKIFKKLYEDSTQHQVGYSNLAYKKGPNDGLVIISFLESTKSVNTLTHTYNKNGHETKFEVVCSKNDSKTQFKMTIDFHN